MTPPASVKQCRSESSGGMLATSSLLLFLFMKLMVRVCGIGALTSRGLPTCVFEDKLPVQAFVTDAALRWYATTRHGERERRPVLIIYLYKSPSSKVKCLLLQPHHLCP
ncbi:hypothetical protein LX32DRAFT_287456 [Colletotrichum zoysiae]|uniref:Uncharacterized protein n=1 Tax=Colletotrichum zoysiae TaxID=1216348 RepID=A0AAD9H1U0_9PEZI|nr:hypothetical protein LX32DRAFT_287456 [Colletotrichum zoysiae]